MNNNYLTIAYQGKNNWWRYLLSTLLILFSWIVIGSFISVIFGIGILLAGGIPLVEVEFQFEELLTNPSLASFLIINLQFIPFLFSTFFAIKYIHTRKIFSLISGDNRIDISRFFAGFGVWLLMQITIIVIGIAFSPSNYIFSFEPSKWFPLLFSALILTPIQTSAEEIFFRGYIIQGLSLLTKNKLALIIISSILFMVPHFLNPEMQRNPILMALFYFSFGAFAAFITLKDNRLELALGVHAANNLTLLFVTTKDSVLQTNAIWTIKEIGETQSDLIVFLVYCTIFYYIFFGRKKVVSR